MDLKQYRVLILHVLPFSINTAFLPNTHSCDYRIGKLIPEGRLKILAMKF